MAKQFYVNTALGGVPPREEILDEDLIEDGRMQEMPSALSLDPVKERPSDIEFEAYKSAVAAPAQDPAQIVGSTQFQQAIAMAKELMPPATPFNPALASLLYFTKMGELASKKGSSVFGSIAGAGVAPAQYLLQKEKEKAARDANIGKTAASLATTLSKSPAAEKAYTNAEGKVVYYDAKTFANLNPNQKANLVPYTKQTELKAKTSSRGGLAMYFADAKSAEEYFVGLGLERNNPNFKRLVEKVVTEDPERVGQAYIGPGGLAMELLPTYLGNKITNLNFSPVPGTQSNEYANKLKRLGVISANKTAFLDKGFNVIPSVNTALDIILSGVQTGQVENRTMFAREMIGSTFGLDSREITGQQMLASISNKLAPGMRPAGSGSTSDIEFAAYKSAVLSLENTPFANYLSLWTLKRVTENSAKASILEENLLSSAKNYSQNYVNDQINKADRGLFSKFKTKDEEGNPLYSTEAAKAVAANLFYKNLPRGDVFLNKDEDGQPIFTEDGKSDLFLIKDFPES